MKSRRLGFTTFEAIDMLDDVLFTPNIEALMLSYDETSSVDIFDNKIKLAWVNFPEELRSIYDVSMDRANKLKFGFGDGMFSAISVRTKGRSGTYHRAHISELGKIAKVEPRKAEEIKSGTIQSIPMDGRCDIESTAEGEIGLFHDMFWDAWNRGAPQYPIEFKAHFYNWTWDDEEIDKIVKDTILTSEMEQGQKFEEYKAKHNLSDKLITYYYFKWLGIGKDWNKLKEQYPTTPEEAFISSGKKYFSQEVIASHQERYARDGEQKGNWIIYDEPLNGHNYVIGADPAEGWGNDNSAACVWDFTYRPKVVAVFKNDKCEPDQFAFELKEYGNKYKEALIIVERNMGLAVLNKLKEIYPIEKIYKEMIFDEEEQRERMKLGFHTNLATKPIIFNNLKTALNNEFVEIPSKELLLEARTYNLEDLKEIKAKKDEIKHWDLLTAAALGFEGRAHIEVGNLKIETYTQKSYVDLTGSI